MNTSKSTQAKAGGRRSSQLGSMLVMALVVGLFTAPMAAFAGGGYPYDHARDCRAQTGEDDSWCIDENGDGRLTSGAEQWSPLGFDYKNCTDWVAHRINSFGVTFGGKPFTNRLQGDSGHRFGDAGHWGSRAAELGWPTAQTSPRARSIGYTSGHVVFVESVNGDGSINISDYNRGHDGRYRADSASANKFKYIYVPGLTTTPTAPKPPASQPTDLSRYRNTIVKWNGDSQTSWFVSPDMKRMWIPDGGTFNQLRARGFGGPHVLDSKSLDQLPDQKDQWVASGSSWGHNRALRRDMSVKSSDGRYTFAMQGDGNLVMYGPSGRAIWSTDRYTSNWRSQEYVIFQGDGNLVTYGGGRAIWHTSTGGRGGNHFEVQSDGNLVVYRDSTPLWASNTGGRT